MFTIFRGSMPVVAFCFAISIAVNSRGDTTQGATIRHFQPTTNTEQYPTVPPATLIPLHQEPANSVAATAIKGNDSNNTQSQLPQLQTAHNDGTGIGTKLQQQLLAKGQQLLTPQSLADSMKQGEGIDIQDTALAMGTQLSQDVINAGLRQVESSMKSHIFRTINLNWSPGFNSREDIYQLDSMMSLYDEDTVSFMSQVGIQSRDNEPAANIGLILRGRPVADWILGVNLFYDYLSDPDIDRWSIGAEAHTSWFSITSNVYTGLSDDFDARLGQTWYSPDGWDIEVSGRAPQLPWLEYSGRYYHWDREGTRDGIRGKDINGQDYKLTIKPMQLLDLSLRYDASNASVRGRKSEFGFEAQLKYQFGTSMNEQTSFDNVAVPQDAWQRRFERVRREYEQRAQSRGGSTRQSTQCTTQSPLQPSCMINVPSDIPPGTVSFDGTFDGTSGSAMVMGTVSQDMSVNCTITGGNSFLEITRTGTGLACGYDSTANSFTITIIFRDTGRFNYDLNLSFKDSSGTELGTTTAPLTVNVTGPEVMQPGSTICTGGSCDTTFRVSRAPEGTIDNVDVTVTGRTVITAGTAIGTASSSSSLLRVSGTNCDLAIASGVTGVDETASDCDYDQDTSEITVRIVQEVAGSYTYDLEIEFQDSGDNDLGVATALLEIEVAGGVTSSQSGALTVTEGGAAGTYTLVLDTEPSGTVTITLTSSDTDAVTVTPMITFDATDWNTMKAVTVTAVGDADATSERETISYGISGGGYDGVTLQAQTVTVDDDETAGITVNPATIAVGENDSATFTVVLDTEPTGTVTVTLNLTGAATDLRLSTTSAPTLTNTLNLTFNSGNWSNTQTVTLTAMDDSNSVSEVASISYTATGGGYGSVTQSQVINVADDEGSSVMVAASPTTIVEGGATSTLTFSLTSTPPSGTVIITPELVDASSSGVEADYTLSAPSVELNTGNSYRATITVTAMDDSANENEETIELSYAITGTAANVSPPGNTTLIVEDDDEAMVAVTGTFTITEGTTGTSTAGETMLTFTLTNAVVTGEAITVTPMRDDSSDAATTDYTIATSPVTDPVSVTLSMTNLTGTITVTADADAVDEANEDLVLSYTVTGDGTTAGVAAIANSTITITDDDSRGINPSTAPALTIDEGDSEEYTLVLTSEPTDTVTIELSLTGSDITALSFAAPPTITAMTSLTFTTGNWDTAQTVTVYAAEDDDSVGETANISFTITGGDYSSSTPPVALADQNITVADNEGPSVVVTPDVTTIVEGGATSTLTFTLSMDPADSGTVIITPELVDASSSGVEADYTLSAASVELNTGNSYRATITVTAMDDSANENEETIELSYMIGGTAANVSPPGNTTLIVEDDDEAMVAVTGTTTIAEGTTGTSTAGETVLTFTLTNAVVTGEAITVTAMRDNSSVAEETTDYSLSDTSVTLSMGSGSMTGTITVTAVADAVDEANEDLVLSYTVTGAGAAAGVAAITNSTITITDDDSRGINPSTAPALTIDEGDSEEYTLVLTSEPTDTVTIELSMTGSDITALSFDMPPTITAMTSLTFTTGNWDDEQTVTVYAAEDDDSVGETANISFTITGGDYSSSTPPVTLAIQNITVADNEGPSVVVTPDVTTIVEGGATSTLTFTLSMDPADSGTVIITPELVDASSSGVEADYTLSAPSVELNMGNSYRATITVTAMDDSANENEETIELSYAITGTAANVSPPGNTTLIVEDDDEAMVAVTGTTTITEGTTGTTTAGETVLTFTLTNAVVTGEAITVTPMRDASSTAATTDYTIATSPVTDPVSVTLSMTNLTGTITVTADADAVDEANEDLVLSYTVTGAGAAAGVAAIANSTITITDDDSRGINPSTAPALTIDEGDSEEYTLVLTSEPTDTVTIALMLTGSDIGALSFAMPPTITAMTTLTFTTANWDDEQTVTVYAAEDDDSVGETANISFTITGGDYSGSTPPVALADQNITVADNEGPSVVVTPDVTTIVEGGAISTLTFTLSMDPADSGTVIITPDLVAASSSGVEADYTLTVSSSPVTSVELNTGNSYRATITVTAMDDSANENEETIELSYMIGGTAANVSPPGNTTLTVEDDDEATVAVTGTTTITEGTTGTSTAGETVLTFTLTNAVVTGEAITVTPMRDASSTAATTDYTIATSPVTDPVSVTLSMTNLTGTITVTADADAVDEANEDLVLSYTVTGAGAAAGVAAITNTTITITDDDSRGINPSTAPALTIDEGDSEEYTLVLTSEPTDTVTIALMLTGSDITALSFTAPPTITATTSLEFTTGNWDTAQTVTVYAAEDDDSVGETATIGFTIMGGDYSSSTPPVTLADQNITVADNEGPSVVVTPDVTTIAEGGATSTLTFTLSMDPADSGTVIITPELVAASSSGVEADYTLSVSSSPVTSVELNTGNMYEATITVTAMDDGANENEETIELSYMIGGTAANVSPPGNTTLTIEDDDEAMVAVTGTTTITEGTTGTSTAGETMLTFALTNAVVTGEAITVTPMRDASSTAATTDYTIATSPVTDPVSVTLSMTNLTGTITVTAVADAVDEANEDLVLSYTVTGAGAAAGVAAIANSTITITDDDSRGINPSTAPALTIDEGDSEDYTLVLTSEPTDTVTIALMLTGSDIGALSFAAPPTITATTTLTFTTGNWSTAQTVTVYAAEDDDSVGETAAIGFTITGGDYSSSTPPVTLADQNITVADNEGPSVVVTPDVTTIAEGGAISTLTFTLSMDPADSGTVIITPELVDASSTGVEADYTLSAPSVELNMGNSYRATITVTAMDDSDNENEETIELSYMIGGTAANVSPPGNTTLTIEDDDIPEASITAATLTISEDATDTPGTCGASTLCRTFDVSLDDIAARMSGVTVMATVTPTTGAATTLGASGDYTVSVTTSGGTETQVTSSPFPVLIEGGTQTSTITVTVVNDDEVEADGEITLSLPASTDTDSYTVAGTSGDVVVTITSEDVPEASITVTAPGETEPETTGTVTVPESGSDNAARTATVTVTFTPATTEVIGLPVTVTGDASAFAQLLASLTNTIDAAITNTSGGALGIDSAGGSDVLTIRNVPAGDSFSFNITINDDTLNDDNEGYTIAIEDTAGSFTAHDTNNSITINIEDDDVPAITNLDATDGDEQVTLMWTNPSDDEINSVIISAVVTGDTTKVDINGDADGTDLTRPATSGGADTVTIMTADTDLANSMNYTFSIVVVDEKGTMPDIRTYTSEADTYTATPLPPPPSVSLSSTVTVSDAAVNFTVQLDEANRPVTATAIEVTVALTGAGVRGVGVTDGDTETVTINWDPNDAASDEGTLSLSRAFSTIGVNGTITATVQDDDPIGTDYFVTADESKRSATTPEAITDARPTYDIGSVTVGMCDPGTGTTAPGILIAINRIGTYQATTIEAVRVSATSDGANDAAKSIVELNQDFAFLVGVMTANFCHPLKDGYPGGDMVSVTISASGTARIPSTTNPTTENMASGTLTETVMVPLPPPEASITITEPGEGKVPGTSATVSERGASASGRRATLTITLDPAPADNTMLAVDIMVTPGGTANSEIGTGTVFVSGADMNILAGGRAVGAVISGNILTLMTATFVSGSAQFVAEVAVDTINDEGESYTFAIVAGTGYTPDPDTTGDPTVNTVTLNIEDDDVPAVVDDSFMAEAGNAQVVLSWTNPTDAELDKVRVSATANSMAVDLSGTSTSTTGTVTKVGNNLELAATSGSAGDVTVTGLANGTAYTFSIVAVDEKGTMPDIRTYTSAAATADPVTPALPVASISVGDSSEATIVEAAGEATITVTFTPAIASHVDLSLMVTSTGGVTDSFGEPGDDTTLVTAPSPFTGPTSGVITISSVAAGDNYTFTITGMDAGTDNDDGKSYTFTLQDVAGSYAAHDTDNAVTINIEDDDVPAITNLDATGGPEQVTLTWTNPVDTEINSVRISAVVTGDTTAIDLNGDGVEGTDLTRPATSGVRDMVTIMTADTGLASGTGYTFSIVVVDNKAATGNIYESATPDTYTATPMALPMASITITEPGEGKMPGTTANVPNTGSNAEREAIITITLDPAPDISTAFNIVFVVTPTGGADAISTGNDAWFYGVSFNFGTDTSRAMFPNVIFTEDGGKGKFSFRMRAFGDDGEGYTIEIVNGEGYTADPDTSDNTVTFTII